MADYGKLKDFLDDLRTHFFERLKRKTGWGKDEVRLEFERAISDAMVDAWDRKETTS